jgi:hypothetical protein
VFRDRSLAKPVLALIGVAAVALAVSGCAFFKPGSLALSQPQGIGSVRVHFNLCTVGGDFCDPNEDTETVQYLIGIAVPPGSAAPENFTAVPSGGVAPIAFTRNDTVASEIAVSSASLQNLFNEVEDPEEEKAIEEIEKLLGSAWPPSGLQGIGYLSAPVQEVEGASGEWTVDADFGLPIPADGGPFPGPFASSIAIGFRVVDEEHPASRPVHCLRFEKEAESSEDDAFCAGGIQQIQIGSADLRIGKPAKTAKAFVGGSGQLSFPLAFAGTPATPPAFALSATTTAKGGKAKPAPRSFTPGSAKPTGKVTVSVPRKAKPGTYRVTLTATTPQGATATQTGKLKVTRPKLKLGAVKLDPGKGTAILRVKVPSGGRLTISGKGVTKVKKKSKKAKTLKVGISAAGGAGAELERAGSVKLKVKAKFKPSSGIAVSKTKAIVLKQG